MIPMRILPWLAAPLLAGCYLFDPLITAAAGSSSEWYSTGAIRKPRPEILATAREILVRESYKVPPFNPQGAWLETEWKVELSSHWREGYRTKVEVELVPADGGRTDARVRSYREFNDNARTPMMIEDASWIAGSLDDKHADKIPEPALRLRYLLRFKLTGMEQND
jgi:hypothetical protein